MISFLSTLIVLLVLTTLEVIPLSTYMSVPISLPDTLFML